MEKFDNTIADSLVSSLCSKLSHSESSIPFTVVRINKKCGLSILKQSESTHNIFAVQVKQCVEQAKKDYFQRYELITMSVDNNHFLFFDNYLSKFQLWNMHDQSTSVVSSFLQKSCNKGVVRGDLKEMFATKMKQSVKQTLENRFKKVSYTECPDSGR